MNLLVIVLSLGIDKFFDTVAHFRRYEWFSHYAKWVQSKLGNESQNSDNKWYDVVTVLVIVLLPVLLCGFIFQQLNDVTALFGVLFGIAILLYSFGANDYFRQTQTYIDALELDNTEEAEQIAQQLLDDAPTACKVTPPPEYEQKHATDNPSNPHSETQKQICSLLFTGTQSRFISVLFWFIILGPMGALFIRLSQLLYQQLNQADHSEQSELANTSRYLFSILNWLPAQLCALCFAVAGSFVDALHEWRQRLGRDYLDPTESDKMLIKTGFGSMQLVPDAQSFDLATVKEALALCGRSIISGITVVALITLAGWAG